MSDNSSIEWTDTTWNPTTGCDRVSPGCDNCYALTMAKRLKGMGSAKYQNDGDPRTSGRGFGLTVHPDSLNTPFTWKKPRKVFVNSMSDLFHARVPLDFVRQVFEVMEATPQHTYQVLTKRATRLPKVADKLPWPSNVWMGTSVENQEEADRRIPALLAVPAAVRFLSCEPLLGPIDLTRISRPSGHQPEMVLDVVGQRYGVPGRWQAPASHGIDWVIVGGESGRDARPVHPNWVRSLRDQCEAAGVPFFFKQWGEWGPAPFVVRVCDPTIGWQGSDEELTAAKRDAEARGATHVHTGNPYRTDDGQTAYYLHEIGHKPWSLERAELPDDHLAPMRRWGKKAAGRELDGRTWGEYPQAVTV